MYHQKNLSKFQFFLHHYLYSIYSYSSISKLMRNDTKIEEINFKTIRIDIIDKVKKDISDCSEKKNSKI